MTTPALFFATELAAQQRAAMTDGANVFHKVLADGRTIWGVHFPDVPSSAGDPFKRMRARQSLEP
jgi:hypothetical protein